MELAKAKENKIESLKKEARNKAFEDYWNSLSYTEKQQYFSKVHKKGPAPENLVELAKNYLRDKIKEDRKALNKKLIESGFFITEEIFLEMLNEGAQMDKVNLEKSGIFSRKTETVKIDHKRGGIHSASTFDKFRQRINERQQVWENKIRESAEAQ